MSDATRTPFDSIPLGGAVPGPMPAFSRSTVVDPPPAGGLLPPTRKPVAVTVPEPAPTPPAAPPPLGNTPPPKAGSLRGFIWDLVRPTRGKLAVLAGGVSLVAGAYGLNLIVPTSPAASRMTNKEKAEVARLAATGGAPSVGEERKPAPKIGVERTGGSVAVPPELLPAGGVPTTPGGVIPVEERKLADPIPLPKPITLPIEELKPTPLPVEPPPLPRPTFGDPPPLPKPTFGDPTPIPVPKPADPAPLPKPTFGDSLPVPKPVEPLPVPKPGGELVTPPAPVEPVPLPKPAPPIVDATPLPKPAPPIVDAAPLPKPAFTDITPEPPLPKPKVAFVEEVPPTPVPKPEVPDLPPRGGTLPMRVAPAPVITPDPKPELPDPTLLRIDPTPKVPVPPPPKDPPFKEAPFKEAPFKEAPFKEAPFKEAPGAVLVPVAGGGGTKEAPPAATISNVAAKRGVEVDVVKVRNTDTYAAISESYYQSRKYAAALKAFNGNADIATLSEVEVPPLHELNKPPAREPVGGPVVRGPITDTPDDQVEWGPAGKRRPVVEFRKFSIVEEGMTPRKVAKTLYGDENEWPKLIAPRGQRLRADDQLPRGTELTYPWQDPWR